MQISYNLLKEYVDIDIKAEELAECLSKKGIVIAHTKPVLEKVRGVLVGEIVEIEPIYGSENLSVCIVDIKNNKLNIVCGAKNIQVGDYVPVVIEGGTLPGLKRVEGKKIQGVYSEGMICSASELGLEKSKSPGVLVLDKNFPLGANIEELEEIGNDVIFDVEIFSNRPDLLSIIGIAREISVFTGKPLRLPEIKIKEIEELVSDCISVEVIDAELCPRYSGRVIKGLQVKESPFWLRWKLFLLGIRPINNIVDVTNYVMMETGQPLHAFDLSFIHGQKIIVRRANSGERLITLDGVKRILTRENLVIADCDRAIALAGVMGGENSEIQTTTKDVFLESAYFDPVNNRRTSRHFSLRTDASNRFEKGIDPYGQVFALNRAAYLINQITSGKILSGVIDQFSKKLSKKKSIKLEIPKVNRILGTNIGQDNRETKEKIIDILTKLEFKIDKQYDNCLELTPPTFRGDVEREIDVIEEIARIFGYENIPSTLFNSTVVQEGKDKRQKTLDKIRNILISLGMHEIISYSMITPKYLDWLKLPNSHYLSQTVKLANPLIQEQTILRTTLIPGIIKTIQWNINHRIDKIKVFEIGRVYFPQNKSESKTSLPMEKIMIGGGITKIGRGNLWEKTENWDLYYLKGILESLFDSLRIYNIDYLPGDLPFFQTNENVTVTSRGKTIAIFGKLHPDITEFLDIKGNLFIFELDFAELYSLLKKEITYQPLPKYPYIQRDLAIVVAENINFAQIKREVEKVRPDIIQKVELFDVFRGKQIKMGYKSMAFSIFFQAEDRTLTDSEIDKIIENVTIKLKKDFQAELR